MRLVPDVPPKVFTFSAVVVGFILLDDMTANEQNALGNWLMLTAQVLCTNAVYKQVQQEREQNKAQSQTPTPDETIQMMQKMINAMQKEIDEIKKSL